MSAVCVQCLHDAQPRTRACTHINDSRTQLRGPDFLTCRLHCDGSVCNSSKPVRKDGLTSRDLRATGLLTSPKHTFRPGQALLSICRLQARSGRPSLRPRPGDQLQRVLPCSLHALSTGQAQHNAQRLDLVQVAKALSVQLPRSWTCAQAGSGEGAVASRACNLAAKYPALPDSIWPGDTHLEILLESIGKAL